jgi:hypothetical protein
MGILAAYDLTWSFGDAGELVGCSYHMAAQYVRAREEDRLGVRCPSRPARGDRPVPCEAGGAGRAVSREDPRRCGAREDHRDGVCGSGAHHPAGGRTDQASACGREAAGVRPWVPEPGMWLQYDFGERPRIGAAATILFCFWLAWWPRFRIVLPLAETPRRRDCRLNGSAGQVLRRTRCLQVVMSSVQRSKSNLCAVIEPHSTGRSAKDHLGGILGGRMAPARACRGQ